MSRAGPSTVIFFGAEDEGMAALWSLVSKEGAKDEIARYEPIAKEVFDRWADARRGLHAEELRIL